MKCDVIEVKTDERVWLCLLQKHWMDTGGGTVVLVKHCLCDECSRLCNEGPNLAQAICIVSVIFKRKS